MSKLCVIGLGLIGGSLALELKQKGFVSEVIGVDSSEEHCGQALELGLVDRIESYESGLKSADLVVFAIPVDAIHRLLPDALSKVSDETIITDMGSTKEQICLAVVQHPRRHHYVASHPMAGTEFSGPKSAKKGLFSEKAAVICEREKSEPRAVQKIVEMYETLQMRLAYMSASDHDLHTAFVSHLSHISSFVLANTILEKEKDVDAIFDLASGGFESTVRLAKSSPEMWVPIFEQNRAKISEALIAYIDQLKLFQESLEARNFSGTKSLIERANGIKRVLIRMKK